jgi:cellobiose phosphorylase
VPYAVEAWPEGDQRHLSAESGLYCRIVTEGMFGFRPTGFRSFTLTPQLPDAWNQMTLRRMYACAERPYDIIVKRTGKKLHIRIERDGSCIRKYTADNGTTIRIEL